MLANQLVLTDPLRRTRAIADQFKRHMLA